MKTVVVFVMEQKNYNNMPSRSDAAATYDNMPSRHEAAATCEKRAGPTT